MAQLIKVVLYKAGQDGGAGSALLGLHIAEFAFAGGGQADPGGATVVWIGETLDELVLLEVVDESRDVPRADVEGGGKLAESRRSLTLQPPEHREPALAEAVAVQPAVHRGSEGVGGRPKGGQRLGPGDVRGYVGAPDVFSDVAVE